MSDLAGAARILGKLADVLAEDGWPDNVDLHDLAVHVLHGPDGVTVAAALLDAARAELAPTADELWAWLLACTTCGHPHELRRADPPSSGWTWARDGHGYHNPLGPRLVRERERWEALRGAEGVAEPHPAPTTPDQAHERSDGVMQRQHGASEPGVDDWVALSNVIHAVTTNQLGRCRDTGNDTLCHDIADAVIAAGWQPPS